MENRRASHRQEVEVIFDDVGQASRSRNSAPVLHDYLDAIDSARTDPRITGIVVREATAEVEPTSGAIVQAFTTGTVVQVFLMDGSSPTETWSGTRPEKIPDSNERTPEVLSTGA